MPARQDRENTSATLSRAMTWLPAVQWVAGAVTVTRRPKP